MGVKIVEGTPEWESVKEHIKKAFIRECGEDVADPHHYEALIVIAEKIWKKKTNKVIIKYWIEFMN